MFAIFARIIRYLFTDAPPVLPRVVVTMPPDLRDIDGEHGWFADLTNEQRARAYLHAYQWSCAMRDALGDVYYYGPEWRAWSQLARQLVTAAVLTMAVMPTTTPPTPES